MEEDIPYQVDEMSHSHQIIEVECVCTLHHLGGDDERFCTNSFIFITALECSFSQGWGSFLNDYKGVLQLFFFQG